MNPEKKPIDVIDQTLEELLGAKDESPQAELQAETLDNNTPYMPKPISYQNDGGESTASISRANDSESDTQGWVPASTKEINKRLPSLVLGSILTIISTIALTVVLSNPHFIEYSSGYISLDGWRILLLPMQIFWVYGLFGVTRAAFAKYGKYPIAPFAIVIMSCVSWLTMPTFFRYVELSGSAIPLLLDPLFSIWVLCQLAWPFLISNYLQAKESKNGKPNQTQSALVSLAANAYLLSSALWKEIPFYSIFPAISVQCQFCFGALWAVSQIWCIAFFCEKLKAAPAKSRAQEAPTKTVYAGGDIVIVYKAFAAIERWRNQQQKALKKEMRTILWISIPIILICYGTGLFLVAKMGSVTNLLSAVIGSNAATNSGTTINELDDPFSSDTGTRAENQQAQKQQPPQPISKENPLSVLELSPEYSAGANSSFVVMLSFVSAICALVAGMVVLKQPTHLGLSPTGWRFLWRRGLHSADGDYVQWDKLQRISITRPKGKTSPLDELLCFKLKSGKMHKVKMGSIESVDDREQLLKAIEKWAPNVERDASVIQALTPAADHSYTELWLQALSAPPERERLKPLSANMILQDGKYKVTRQLGTGGQGQAYLATDSESNEGVVLKEFILPVYVDVNVRRAALEQFENEARLLRQIDHPRIVKLIDFFVEDHRTYLVLEHIKGGSLRELVKSKGKLDQAQVRSLALQMCNILSYLHNLNPPIIHRDFTPDNLILNYDGTLKLIDFNVAKQVLESTTSGTVVGKHAYLPPEQFRGMPECASDIYAMGATLHFLLTGQDPEPISTSHPKRVDDSISEKLNALVERATALNTAKRYAKVEELLTDLEST